MNMNKNMFSIIAVVVDDAATGECPACCQNHCLCVKVFEVLISKK